MTPEAYYGDSHYATVSGAFRLRRETRFYILDATGSHRDIELPDALIIPTATPFYILNDGTITLNLLIYGRGDLGGTLIATVLDGECVRVCLNDNSVTEGEWIDTVISTSKVVA